MSSFFYIFVEISKMINSVRNTVLSVLNKNNYGYISPSDFNLYSKQAQMEIYDEYYSNYNKIINAENARVSGTDYANIRKTISEVLETFLVTNFLSPLTLTSGTPTNQFFNPSLITTGDESYTINKINCHTTVLATGTNTSVTVDELTDSAANFITSNVSVGDIVVNKTTVKATTVVAVIDANNLLLEDDFFLATPEDYIIYSSVAREAEKVTSGKITLLNNSLLTAPSNTYPAYTSVSNKIIVYPTTINTIGQLQATYFRYPRDPKWTYVTILGGEPSFDQTQPDYQDFELPNEDEYKLVMKILQYCGLSIREAEVVQYALGQEQHEQPTFSQKQ